MRRYLMCAVAALVLAYAPRATSKRVSYQAVCAVSSEPVLRCHIGSWYADKKWADRATAQKDAEAHNKKCKGHAAQVMQVDEE